MRRVENTRDIFKILEDGQWILVDLAECKIWKLGTNRKWLQPGTEFGDTKYFWMQG